LTALAFVATAAGLLCFGAHVAWPLAAARDAQVGRRWSLMALALAVAAAALFLWFAGTDPDVALAAGIAPGLPKAGARTATILLAAALLADLLLFVGTLVAPGKSPRALEWRLVAGFGLAGLLGWSWLAELLRLGDDPMLGRFVLAVAVVCRGFTGLAAGEIFAPGRPWLGLVSLAGLAVYPLTLPAATRTALVASGDLWTLVAAAILLGSSRFLPHRLIRPALAAGALLAALWFTRLDTLPRAQPPTILEIVQEPEP
jgi:hypothetical protein